MSAMHCTKRINDDLVWVGANDRRLAMFEGVYSVPGGVSYNSYLLEDEKTVIFDTRKLLEALRLSNRKGKYGNFKSNQQISQIWKKK